MSKKKTYAKYPINDTNQGLLSYNIYTNEIYCEKEKQKHIRGVFRSSVKHPRRNLLRKQSTASNSYLFSQN